MQIPDRLLYLFERYMNKTYTHEEKNELMNYINSGKYDAALHDLISQGWHLPLPAYEQDPQKATAIFNTIVEKGTASGSGNGRVLFFLKYMAAAVLLVVIGGALYYYSYNPAKAPLASHENTTPAVNEHQYITLPDGSKVLLNAGSQLHYPDSFGNTREVQLSGEAYFDIRHSDTKPFIVRAGNTKTVVLGTAFNIKAFPGDNNIIVTVTRGKVRVEKNQHVAGILTPNEQLTVSGQSNDIKKEVVNAQEIITWKQDDIVLDDVPLHEVIKDIEHRFNATIALSKPALGNCRITASFLHHETLEQIIQVITRINQMDYRFEPGNKIVLTGEGCI